MRKQYSIYMNAAGSTKVQLPAIFIRSPTKAVSVPCVTSFSRIFTMITAQPPTGPRKNPANNAGSSAISNFRKPGAKGSGTLISIRTAESAPNIPMKAMLLELLISFIPVSSFMWGRRKGLERMKTPEPSHPNYTIGHETAPCQRISSWINSFTSLGFNACADHPV